MTRAPRLARAAAAAALAAACASAPAPAPRRAPSVLAARPPRPAPAPIVDRSVEVAQELGVGAADLVWNPGRSAFAASLRPRDTAGDVATPALHVLRAYRRDGEPLGVFPAVRPGPIAELRFLGEDRLVYLAPPAAPAARKRLAAGRARKASPPPTTVYAIQPITEGAAPVLCEGRRFVFSPGSDHIAFVAGDPGHESVGVDGAQVYPRSGVTTVQGTPAWSRDGTSLALIEGGKKLQLVVLVEVDNPNGDNTWPLPPEAADPSLHVFWAGVGNIVVGRELTKPVFATSFRRE